MQRRIQSTPTRKTVRFARIPPNAQPEDTTPASLENTDTASPPTPSEKMDLSSPATTVVIQSLRNAGVRPTIPRIAVYQIVASMEPAGIGAEQLLDALPARGFPAAISTVYRTITELESLGLLVRSQDSAGRRVYLTNACAQLGKIYFRQGPRGKLKPVVDPALYEHLSRLAQQQGMDWRGKSLVVQAGD
ncbi:hypothetical protein G7047_11020 [Diaphorobacter sp. HDW4A]|uniref:Fur family transcriptional regulator n=1 Tax=Diaphorobacter sp. HDW4A TaxID=2714924 RepID=UPI00140DD8EB|nr:transcriptional repressor [Diaphorobacter sp. HDW4A]QIL80374.1 hypothetical protein G7047_11020 [Diaphorobacter sp. HDW4A]